MNFLTKNPNLKYFFGRGWWWGDGVSDFFGREGLGGGGRWTDRRTGPN